MWTPKKPNPVKLFVGILASDEYARQVAAEAVAKKFGKIDLESNIWPFDKTNYYREQTGEDIIRQFISIEKLIDPGKLAKIKHWTNRLEQKLAAKIKGPLPRPVNLDPGIIEPSKLILATTKNYSHRIYIGKMMYAEVTLIYDKGCWQPFAYTYPDYRQQCYFEFFEKVRKRLLEQLKSIH